MKKASSSFLLVLFAALLVSFQSYAQISVKVGRPDKPNRPGRPEMPLPQNEIIQEQVNLSLRTFERLRLSDLLRLSWQDTGLELISLRVMAQSLVHGPSQLEISARGRVLATQVIRRQLQEVTVTVPPSTFIEELELSTGGEIYISSLTAEVRRNNQRPGPGQGNGWEAQVSPQSALSVQVNQTVRGFAEIDLARLVKEQMGLTLEGAEIERVVVMGQPGMYGRSASVQVALNRRPVSDIKYLSAQERQVPLRINSLEEARSLALLVNGDAQIFEVRIRIGQVRPRGGQPTPRPERIFVNQEVSPVYPLELGQILRYESRLIKSITIEARSLRQAQAQLSLFARRGEGQGVLFIGPNTVRATLQLRRPMAAHELRLEAAAPILIQNLELEFDMFPRY
jgi:predicted DNA-binding protein (UPF0251 family)